MRQSDVGKSLGRNRGFVGRAVKRYFTEGKEGLKEQRGGDRRSELSQEQKEEIGYIINHSYPINAKGWDGKIIVDLIECRYGLKVSRESVYYMLKQLNISYKKAKKVDPKKSEIKIREWKMDIKKKLSDLSDETILFSQDESRFCSESNRVTSWSAKGKAVVYSGYRYGTALNCFGSINLKNAHLITSFHDRGNAKATIEHLQKVRDVYNKNIPLAFFMDNATWHKTKEVKEFCKNNNITLLFLPPYSPEYNPIERVWSFLKSKVRQRFFSTADSFKKFIYKLLDNVNLEDFKQLSNLCCSLI